MPSGIFPPRGCVQHLHALAEQLFLVRRHGAGIGVQVFIGAELQGIYENADDHHIAQAPRLAHQVEVALVQVAHGGNEGNALAFWRNGFRADCN